ncbi:MAG: hypothetical protein HY928_04875 [Elusimicrobia bacterium]|nr:hypothetical protein [Elusimicrobiota bacterium]
MLTFLIAALLPLLPAVLQAKVVSPEERREVLRRAHVREDIDPSTRDLLNGPQGPGAYGSDAEVRCRYEEKDPKRPLGGHSKKFPCWTADGERLKIKYDGSANPEVFGEVAGSRLLWGLGFYAERLYSVKLVCENCPADPWTATADSPRATRTFFPVSIQKRLKGTEVSETEEEGFTFDELGLVDESAGGSSPAEADALKLLAVFMNHGDNTANQQRLLCLEGDEACKRPIAYITDAGGTFGGKGYFTSYRNWAKKKSLWKDPSQCLADFETTSSRSRDPKVSEAGRALLSELLGKLSEKQIRDLFTGARFDALGKLDHPIVDEKGRSRPAVVEDWVKLFMKRREQISTASCPQ